MFALQSKLIWEQDDPILDFALTDVSGGATPSLLVLESGRIVLFRLQGQNWVQQQIASLPVPDFAQRDLRGRLLFERTMFTLYVPEVSCTGFAPKSLTLECAKEDFWDFFSTGELSAGGARVERRNFFSKLNLYGIGAGDFPDVFTTVGLGPNNHPQWLVAATDGLARLYDESGELLVTFTGWGSDFAAIETDCGSHWQVFATRASDWTEPDAVQAFEFVNREAVAVSALVSFPGPITALWTPTEGNSANAVVHNLKTGKYEAYTLTLSCGR